MRPPKVKGVRILPDMHLLVTFDNNKKKIFDVGKLIPDWPEFELLQDPALFQLVKVESGGYGISWTDELDCSEGELWENGVDVLEK